MKKNNIKKIINFLYALQKIRERYYKKEYIIKLHLITKVLILKALINNIGLKKKQKQKLKK